MLKIRNRSLAAATELGLAGFQATINVIGAFDFRVQEGKRLFKARNRKSNPVFREIRQVLRRMSRGPNRCMYCEDSSADQIDHFRPKDFYPEVVFRWENYLRSCGRCNRRKNNGFYVIRRRTREIVKVWRSRDDPVVPPPVGNPVFLNPRRENPLELIQLDLRDTFEFVATAAKGTQDYERVRPTIKILGLNDRDDVVKARRNAFGNYSARLEQYITRRDGGATANKLGRLRNALLRLDHPTVWEEMKRQRNLILSIRPLFTAAPEALSW